MSAVDALVTWGWQGLAVALAVKAGLWASPRASAATRYVVWWMAMAGVLLLPVVAWLGPEIAAAGGAADVARAARLAVPTAPLQLPTPPAGVVAGLGLLWLASVVIGAARLAIDLGRLRRWRARARPMPADRERRLARWCAARRRGRRARLMVTDDALSASALGFRPAMIVVPRVLLTSLTDDELDQVVAHEHAHVERRDDWATLVQAIIAVVVGVHPAVWYINRALRRDREMAADDRVVRHDRQPRRYAACLAKVASTMTWRHAPRLASTAGGASGEMLRRVARLLDPGRNGDTRPSGRALAAATLAGGVVVTLLGGMAPLATFAPRPVEAPRPPVSVAARTTAMPAARGPSGPPSASAAADRGTAVVEVALVEPPARMTTPLPGIDLGAGVRVAIGAERLPQAFVYHGAWPRPLRATTLEAMAPLVAVAPPRIGPAVVADAPPPVALMADRPDAADPGWRAVSEAGVSVGTWFAGFGQATAGAFSNVGSSFKRVFSSR